MAGCLKCWGRYWALRCFKLPNNFKEECIQSTHGDSNATKQVPNCLYSFDESLLKIWVGKCQKKTFFYFTNNTNQDHFTFTIVDTFVKSKINLHWSRPMLHLLLSNIFCSFMDLSFDTEQNSNQRYEFHENSNCIGVQQILPWCHKIVEQKRVL